MNEENKHHRHHIPVKIWVDWQKPHDHKRHHCFYCWWHRKRGTRMLPTLQPGQFVIGTVWEKDAQGNQFAPPPGNISVQSADPTKVSIVNNGDGTITATGIAPGSTTETIGDSAFPSLPPDVEPATVADVPVAIGVDWGTPQSPSSPAQSKK